MKNLEDYIVEKLQEGVMNYIFIDDAYKCTGFQKVLSSLLARGNADLYISGSNRTALTEGLSDFQLVNMLPYSFAEYLEAQRLLKFLGYFVSIPSDKIPINSIAREFVGGSIFKV